MADVIEKTNGDHLDSSYGSDMTRIADHLRDHSKLKSNGIRDVSTDGFNKAIEERGVTREEVKRVQAAVDFVTTAASHVALSDVEAKIQSADKGDLSDDAFRRGLTATVRLPTVGGSTDVTVAAETRNPIPFRGDGGGEPEFKTTYGRLKTSITTKGRVHKDFHEEANARIRAALGVAEDD